MDKIIKIAIKFGDNDFGNVFIPILKVLSHTLDPNKELDKDRILKAINSLSYGCYLANCDKSTKEIEADENRMREYLRIEKKNLFFNEEVDKYLLGETNGATWILEYNSYLDTEDIYRV